MGVSEMLVSAIVKLVIGKLASAVGDQLKMIRNVGKDLEKMKETLKWLDAVLRDAERRSITEETVKLWLKELKKAANEISDMLDDFRDEEMKSKHDMAKKMKKMNKNLKFICEQHERYGFQRESSSVNEQDRINKERETTSRIGSDMIVGRRDEKEKIINILLSTNDEAAATSTVTTMYGIAGVGKTALAKTVFSDDRIQTAFPLRAWVYVGQKFEVDKIGRAIISEVEGEVCTLETRQSISRHLEKVLKSRCLIVLDDLWDAGKMTGLEDVLDVNKEGSNVNILITSRYNKAINWKIPKTTKLNLEPLTDEFSLDLVKQVASQFVLEGDILENANKIVEKCKGVPLAVIALTSLLNTVGCKELLEMIEEGFRGQPSYEEIVIASLRLSLNRMQSHLRLCFAYCAIFPKGCEIDREDLYRQWIALGIIQGSRQAEDYVNKLLEMSFLQDSGAASVTKKSFGAPAKLKMHDLVHDLAISVADDELVVMDREGIEPSDATRYALLVARDDLHKALPDRLRALHFKDCPRLKFISKKNKTKRLKLQDHFSFPKRLWILDISGCCIQNLPASIDKLMHLRYLNASGMNGEELPKDIGHLSKLQYLNLHGSRILVLPESASKLGDLVHLDLSDCGNLHTLPKSFSALKFLSLLTLEKCSNLHSLPDDLDKLKNLEILNLSGCSSLDILPESLGGLESLKQLDLSGCKKLSMLPNSISRLTSLQYLNMSSCFELDTPVDALTKLVKLDIGHLSKLQYLNLHGSRILVLPESASKLGDLVHLDLSDCGNLHTLPKSFSALKCLSLLTLEKCSNLHSLPDDLDKLKNLENLNLSGCSSLDILPESLGDLESLKQLDLSGCKKLSMLPNSISRLTSLQYLNMSSCFELDTPVDALTKLVKLKYLNLSSSPKLLGLPENFCTLEHLHTLNLSDCSNLTSLPQSLEHMTSIKFILLDGCAESLRKPILQHRFAAGLQSVPSFVVQADDGSIRSNISQLEQEEFSELELYHLENVRRIDEAEAIKMSTRSGLQSLGLKWTTNDRRFVEDEALLQTLEPPEVLKMFRVQGYMGDKFPKWATGSLHVKNLEVLHLSWMPKITRLDWSFCGAFRKLRKFTLEYMENLEEWCTTMPSASGQQEELFPDLKELNIFYCPRLTLQPCPPRSIEWEIRASDGAAQLLLKRDGIMRSLAEYMRTGPPFAYTTELHGSDSRSSSSSTTDGWKFHGSLIALKDLTCDCCSSIDTLLGRGSNMQCLVHLEISGVEDVKGLQEQVETIGHSARSSLTKSRLYWVPRPSSIEKKKSIEDGALLHFKVRGYAASGVLPGSIEDITSFLQNLIRINMDELTTCDRLPPLGQLPRLQNLRLKGMPKIRKIDRDFCGGNNSSSTLFFPSLTNFVLNGMPNLEEWATKVSSGRDHDGREEFMFPRLVKLAIWNCPKLKLKPCPPRAVEWDINNSDELIASSYDINTGDELATTLQVLLCKVPPDGWRLLRHLSRIQNLAIISCHEMKALPESVQSLSSLQSLAISKCDNLEHLPEWLGDLISLQNLMVVSCPMKFLPGCLRRLNFLRSLSLSYCDGIAALPGWLCDLTSLRKLTIEGCKSLKFLPELTKLEDLLIGFNDELKEWCKSEAKLAHIIRKGFWLDSPTGSNSYMLPARSLSITYGDDERYWRRHSVPESRYDLPSKGPNNFQMRGA